MLAIEQAQELLNNSGVEAPVFVVEGWLSLIESIESCLDVHYKPEIAALILGYLIQLYGLSYGFRYVKSQSAPSGTSESFDFPPVGDRYRGVLGLLKLIDKKGCATGLIPPDPDQKGTGFLYVSTGGCY